MIHLLRKLFRRKAPFIYPNGDWIREGDILRVKKSMLAVVVFSRHLDRFMLDFGGVTLFDFEDFEFYDFEPYGLAVDLR